VLNEEGRGGMFREGMRLDPILGLLPLRNVEPRRERIIDEMDRRTQRV